MKKILILILAIVGLADTGVFAQTIEQVTGVPENETKAERKAREKRLKALADSVAFVEANNAIDANYFVITADRLTLGNGYSVMAPEPSTNFILVQGDKATVQIAFNNGHMGLNGLGGITVEGTVRSMKKEITKKGDIRYDFSVQGTAISAQVNIVVYKNSNSAMAYINSNFNSAKMTVYGPLIPYDHNSQYSMFKGKTMP